MTALFLSWLLMTAASWRLGSWVLHWSSAGDEFAESETVDTLFVGLISLAVVALASAVVFPARWGALLLPLLAFAGPLPPFLRKRPSVAVLCLTVLAAAVSLGWISSRDSITYHHDLVHLLSEGGVVRGMGWIHGRFGYVSAWLALTSWLHQPGLGLAGRMDTAVNGLLLLFCLLDLYRAAETWRNGGAGFRAKYTLAAWTVTLPLPVYLNFVSSPSPDFAVIVYAVVAGRLLLISDTKGHSARNARIALWIGCCAFAVKLSALPIAAVSGWVALKRGGLSLSLIRMCVLGSVPVLLWMFVSWWMTGYPLYPTTVQWTDVSWQLPEAHALLQKEVVHNFAYWGGAVKPETLEGVARFTPRWAAHWIRADVVNALGGLAFVAGMLSLPVLFGFRPYRRVFLSTAFLGLAGSGFLLFMAPAPRFGLGFLLLLPVCLAAAWLPPAPSWIRKTPAGMLPLVLIVLLLCPTWLRDTRSERRIRAGLREGLIRMEPGRLWLRPRLIPHLHFDDQLDQVVLPDPERSHNAPGSTAATRSTWYPPVPMDGGRYVDSVKGWRGGFRRMNSD